MNNQEKKRAGQKERQAVNRNRAKKAKNTTKKPLPYLREHPLASMLPVWQETCEKGFALGGRGALLRTTANRLGKAGYLPASTIKDPVGCQVVSIYDPNTEFVVAEPNETGGTRWQIFQRQATKL